MANKVELADHLLAIDDGDDWEDLEPTTDLYFIGIHRGPVKIGFSGDVERRLGQIRTSCPYPVKLEALLLDGAHLERFYHKLFSEFRLEGEWFRRVPIVEDEIRRIGGLWELGSTLPLPRSFKGAA